MRNDLIIAKANKYLSKDKVRFYLKECEILEKEIAAVFYKYNFRLYEELKSCRLETKRYSKALHKNNHIQNGITKWAFKDKERWAKLIIKIFGDYLYGLYFFMFQKGKKCKMFTSEMFDKWDNLNNEYEKLGEEFGNLLIYKENTKIFRLKI